MIQFVILCGGSGSRLWPKSREKFPKQFLNLLNDKSMLQNTLLRINNLAENITELCKIIIICNKEHYHIVELQVKELDSLLFSKNTLIVTEPKGRDSAPAICISSLLGSKDDYTFIFPCDHDFNNQEFLNCSLKALNYLEESIVTFGIKPTRIETGYGYIKIDHDTLKTMEFVEKPNYHIAKEYFEAGTYLWNAGIFAFKNENMLQHFQHYADDILESCRSTLKESLEKASCLSIIHLSDSFKMCRSQSIDYAIMEKLCINNESCITIPFNAFWNDIGSYASLYDQLAMNTEDENKNVIKSEGDVKMINSKNCYVDTYKPIVSLIGMENIVVVDTEDALLICNKDETQDVKKVFTFLKEANREEAFLHRKVYRPWGYYCNIYETKGYKMKKIVVYPGKRLSLQSHNFRSEHWVIVSGKGKVQLGKEEIILEKDKSIYIPVKELHRIENIGEELLEFTETQIGDYLGEDDIVRYEDDFGRVV